MDIENSKAQMKKGILEFLILSVLSNGESYVSDLIDELKDSNLLVVEGTLYPLLTRLKNEGVLSYKWVESKSGPPRKYYFITDLGRQFLSELNQFWSELNQSVSHIINKQKTNTSHE